MHPNKHIRAAMEYAVSQGFRVQQKHNKGHEVAALLCGPGCCRISVYGTPQSPENHAKRIRRKVDQCIGE